MGSGRGTTKWEVGRGEFIVAILKVFTVYIYGCLFATFWACIYLLFGDGFYGNIYPCLFIGVSGDDVICL